MSIIKNYFVSKGNKKIAEYILFVVVSLLFWFILTQSETVQDNFEVPIEVENIPDDILSMGGTDNNVLVTVKGSGFSLIKYRIGEMSPIVLDYNKYSRNKCIALGKSEIDVLFRDYFGKGKKVISHTPDSVYFFYISKKDFSDQW